MSRTDPDLTPDTLNTLLGASVRKHPQRIALVTEKASLTYSELEGHVRDTSAAFQNRGVVKGTKVALVLRNSPEFVIAYFALARLGAVAVPINFLIQKVEELEYMLRDSKTVGAVTQAEFLKGLLGVREKLPSFQHLWCTDAPPAELANGVEDFWGFVKKESKGREAPLPSAWPEDVASVLYTSGTTGSPKGVMLTHRNLYTNTHASIEAIGMGGQDVILCILPMFHTFAWTACVLVPLALGGKVVVVPSITPAKPWLGLMAKHGVSVFAAVPQIYGVLSKEAAGLKGLVLRYWFFRKVRLCVSGAAPMPVELFGRFERKFGVSILEGYGLTETSPVATLNRLGARKVGTVGVPIRDVRIKIVDDRGLELKSGEEGEVLISGPNVMKGYLNRPEDTALAISPDGYLKTGDIGTLDEQGYLAIRDRKKDMIIVKGLKVFSAQVEAVLATHPDIEEAAVIGVPGEGGDETIKAFVTLKKGSTPDKSTLLQFCREKLDPYKRPRDIEILAALPKNALQKVLKRELRQKELAKRP